KKPTGLADQFARKHTRKFDMFAPTVTIRPQLCTEHRKEEWTSRRIGYVIFLVAAIALALPFVYIRQLTEANAAYYLVGVMGGLLLMMFYWFGYRLIRRKPVVAAKIQGRDAIIKNIPKELQDALPLAQPSP
ncbi:MAG: hypothetical protein AAF497_29460, partial [Planctomycetota bacterium]